MSNFFEYKDSLVFHPGYYIKELIEESGLTQEDYAKRLGTTPKNLSTLVRGEQSLSIDIAMKLARLNDTSVEYWLNLQKKYDSAMAMYRSDIELNEEKEMLRVLDYGYFRKNFHLPDLLHKVEDQVCTLRKFLNVSSLSVLKNKDMAVRFRRSLSSVSETSIIKANAMVQIATIDAMKEKAPVFDKSQFENSVRYVMTQTSNHEGFYPLIKQSLKESGVVLEVLPNMPGSKINGATKRIGDSILLMVNDRNTTADSFWFSLFHELGHIYNGDYGISFENECGADEESADRFAEDRLIPPDSYSRFVDVRNFSRASVLAFSRRINRDPGIVVGRLQNDHLVSYGNRSLNELKSKYKICIQGD